MISRISGKLVEKKEQSLILDVNGICYEVIVPVSVCERVEDSIDESGNVHLITHYYFQIGPSSGIPILVGFMNEVEKDFFLQFIKVSGIGPRAAVRALSKPICEITRAIDDGDVNYLKTLSGIGAQKAKEIVAKLQGKIGKFGLIQDNQSPKQPTLEQADWQEEALAVLMQLQYKKSEALSMIQKAMDRSGSIDSAEELLNEIYKQRIKKE